MGNQNISDYQYLAPVKNTNTHYLFGTSGYDDTESVSVLGTNWGAANHVSSGTYKKYNCTWGEEAYVREQMQMMKEAFVDKGYPVILGEYGANWREFSNSSIQKKHDASIRHTVSTTSQSAGQYYTLTGLRVAADTKGLLITGGKKIIIK